ncbi:MAG: hypothetical protein Fur0035_18500 [Anaerolineales bacterium]
MVAFVHEWLVGIGGSENLLAAMLALFPDAPVHTLIYDESGPASSMVTGHNIVPSLLQKIPWATQRYRSLLPLMPFAIEQFDLSGYDLIISNSHAVAKGVLTGPDQLHICMCCSPIRYAWDLQHQYLHESKLDRGIKGFFAKAVLHYIRLWDVRTANGIDEFVAISNFIARRIQKVYGRKSTVIYPPVNTNAFTLREQKEDFYLTASRMVPYKRIDLIVEAFAKMPNKTLFVIGDGPEFEKIKAIAAPNVKVLGFQPSDVLKDYMQRAKAFIFAAEEDFGIIPVEAQACGTPVIAYGKGGALETVVDGVTGLFFYEQSVAALCRAVEQFENRAQVFSPHLIRQNSERFSEQRFRDEFAAFVEEAWCKRGGTRRVTFSKG